MKNIIIVGNKYDLEAERKVSELEIRQFCESMSCVYVRCSVLSDAGIEELINTVIVKSMQLENQISGSLTGEGGEKTGADNGIFTIGGSDGLTSGDIKNINPMRLEIKKRNRKCCGAD